MSSQRLPALRERRYSKLTHYHIAGTVDSGRRGDILARLLIEFQRIDMRGDLVCINRDRTGWRRTGIRRGGPCSVTKPRT